MKALAEESQNTENIANLPEKSKKTCSGGSGTEVGKTTTQSQSISQDQVQDILSTLRSVKLWTIEPRTQKEEQNVLRLLESIKIKATYKDAAYWIGRTLAHFPRRDSTKDGIVISDISGAIVDDGLGIMAVASVCEEAWRSSSNENPWFPPTGQLLKDMKKWEVSRKELYYKLKSKGPGKRDLKDKTWESMDEDDRLYLTYLLCSLGENQGSYIRFRDDYGVPRDVVFADGKYTVGGRND